MKASVMPSRAMTPPMGTAPDVMPLANVVVSGVRRNARRRTSSAQPPKQVDHLVEVDDAVAVADRAQPLIAFRGQQHAVEPAIGWTMTAAMVEASCGATRRSRIVGDAPAPARPGEGLLLAVIGGGGAFQANSMPRCLRLATMPPTEMPPKPTP